MAFKPKWVPYLDKVAAEHENRVDSESGEAQLQA